MRMRKAWYRALLRRRFIVAVLLVIQILIIACLFGSHNPMAEYIQIGFRIFGFMIVLHVISRKQKGGYKIAWVLLILLFPVFGGLLYMICYYQASTRRFEKRIQGIEERYRSLYAMPGEAPLQNMPREHIPQARYLQGCAGFPLYDATECTYYPLGQDFYRAILDDLKKAKKYIFLEYFIIEEGKMWDSILHILREKAAEGVKVRVIYDDIGCFLTLPKNYAKSLAEMGIECQVFNPFRPILSARQNNRDHRKIASIDGRVAFTGGINLADEYINAIKKHGYWKDSAIRVEGKAAWSLTLMFLEMWHLCSDEDEQIEPYYPKDSQARACQSGWVQPYCDSPMDEENVSEHVYLQMINQAKDYLYIMTPYLIIDDSMLSALCLAAKSGVDVRIMTPHIWDKRLVYLTTRSYYQELLRNGIKVYEYTPGFVHSKIFVSDDETATVGTVNLDFRSMYLHFECGVWLCGSEAISSVKRDFLDTLEQCQPVTEMECKGNIAMQWIQLVLRLFAPLM